MTPRITKRGRKLEAQYPLLGRGDRRVRIGISHPSPAEKRKARHSAWKQSMRKHGIAVLRTLGRSCADDGWPDISNDRTGMVFDAVNGFWPESRGTTAQQLTAMHLEAEANQERGGKWYGLAP